jgi:hypothetical protein
MKGFDNESAGFLIRIGYGVPLSFPSNLRLLREMFQKNGSGADRQFSRDFKFVIHRISACIRNSQECYSNRPIEHQTKPSAKIK